MTQIKYILLFSILFLSCSKMEAVKEAMKTNENTQTEVTLNEAQFRTVGIETAQIEQHVLSEVIKANGMLDVPPQNMVSISAPLGGFVKNTDLLQGMKVKKGQTLVILEHPDYIQLQQDYLETKNQLGFLQEEFSRQQELAKENVTAAKTFQQVKANFQSSKVKLEALEARLKLIHINSQNLEAGNIQSSISVPSPIEGFVTEINVNLGSYVNPTDVMFEIIDTEHLHAEAEVFERDVLKLKQGQNVRIRLVNETSDREARVFLIGKEISTERTVRVHCHLEKEDTNLLPGMYFSALFETENHKVPSLPEQAFADYEGKSYLFIEINKANHQYKMTQAAKGICENGYCQVTLPEGFDPNYKFVVKGAFELLSQLKNKEGE
jgi:cobalt-zinc-cadmium efflux system membrane fusion protein